MRYGSQMRGLVHYRLGELASLGFTVDEVGTARKTGALFEISEQHR